MISLKEEITVERNISECFDYVADFRNTAEWDSTAFFARKLTDGPIAVGTRFEVRCKLPVGSVPISYEVTEFVPPHRVVLHAECWLFEALDSISLVERGGVTAVEYRADFSFRMPFATFENALEGGMKKMGKASVSGLRRALSNDFSSPTISRASAVADRLLWPGLALFSKLGYQVGRRRWDPDSTSLRGKRMVVTGASSGLGLATARALAARGAELVLVMRNPDRAREVVTELCEETGNSHIDAEIADLALMHEVDALATRLLADGRPIDVLVNNAGALFNDWSKTEEGIERSFALLLLSPWRLTRALRPLLQAAGGARVINVVSGGMYSQKLRVDQLEAQPDGYGGAEAYARCKRALTVVTEEWAEEWEEDGIVVNAMHPGWADTPGVETALPAFHRLTRYILRTPEEGADTIIWLAAAQAAGDVSGKLFLDREPRTTHLLSRTREQPEERERLMEFLESYSVSERAAA